MTELLYITKNGHSPHGKAKVYFTCHPDDFDRTFNIITDDIFKTHDCVIHYYDKREDLRSLWEISNVNLMVIPVTYKLLTSPSPAMDREIPYAMENNVPILPVLIDRDLDDIYAASVFGDMQYLNKHSTDNTEISYADKLKKHLNSVLVDDETVQAIKDAFDAYIFLSYRKIDRRYANELMRIIHDTPRFRDIAIWYDEFLVPGEDFRRNIERALNDSLMVTLLVTPSLLQDNNGEPNFIVREEYPIAVKSGKDIIPAEMEPTDRSKLEAKFEGIASCVDPRNGEDFKQRLLETLTRAAITPGRDDPMHIFLIGLAYLNGIDVEINYPRAIELIARAADEGHRPAIEKLIDIYTTGQGVKADIKDVLKYRLKLHDVVKEEYEKEPTPDNLHAYNNARFELGNTYFHMGEYLPAMDHLSALATFCQETLESDRYVEEDLGMVSYYLMLALCVIANIAQYRKDFKEARDFLEKGISIGQDLILEYNHSWSTRTVALSYRMIAEMAMAENDADVCLEYGEKSLKLFKELAEKHDEEQFSFDVAVTSATLSEMLRLVPDYDRALVCSKESVKIIERLIDQGYDIYESWRAGFYNDLAEIYRQMGDIDQALKVYRKSQTILDDYYEKTGSHVSVQEVLCKFRIGQIYSQLDQTQESLKYLHESLDLYDRSDINTEQIEARGNDLKTIIHLLLGNAYSDLENTAQALYHFRKGAEIADRHVEDGRVLVNIPDYISCYSLYAQALAETGNKDLSRRYFEKAKWLIDKYSITPDNARLSVCIMMMYLNLGIVLTEAEEYEKSIEYLQQTLKMVELLEEQGPQFIQKNTRLLCNFQLAIACSEDYPKLARKYTEEVIALGEAMVEDERDIYVWDALGTAYFYMYNDSSVFTRSKWSKKLYRCADIMEEKYPDQFKDTTVAGLFE